MIFARLVCMLTALRLTEAMKLVTVPDSVERPAAGPSLHSTSTTTKPTNFNNNYFFLFDSFCFGSKLFFFFFLKSANVGKKIKLWSVEGKRNGW